jgi:glycosyltransferase involved in cell wall biosynthesis
MLWHINKSELSTPWLLTVHCVPPFEQGFGYFSGHNAPYYAARNTAGIPSNLAWRLFLSDAEFTYAVCHSEIVATQVTTSGCPSGKIVNIPLGGDFESAVEATTTGSEPFPAGAYPRILSIGGLIHHKGFHDFLPAASSLLRDWPRLHYSVLGETRGWPKYQKYLLEAVERTGMKDHFSLLLNASEAQRQQALESADLYVQPSHEEGFCIAFLEAAAVVPRVIGTRTGAIESAGRDSFGVRVVNVRSPHELEAASRELLGLSVTASDISKRREALTDRFSWEIHGQLHKELYETVARAA